MKTILTFILAVITAGVSFSQSSGNNSAYLGVYYQHMQPNKAASLNFENTNGAYVSRVVQGSAAEQAGIQPFDYIYQINNEEITSTSRFGEIMDGFRSGQTAQIHIVRNGNKILQDVTFTSYVSDTRVRRDRSADPFLGIGESHSSNAASNDGLVVYIVENSSAKAAGMQYGDVITHINDFPVWDIHDAGVAIDLMKVGDVVNVEFLRNGAEQTFCTQIKSIAETYGELPASNYAATCPCELVVEEEDTVEIEEEVVEDIALVEEIIEEVEDEIEQEVAKISMEEEIIATIEEGNISVALEEEVEEKIEEQLEGLTAQLEAQIEELQLIEELIEEVPVEDVEIIVENENGNLALIEGLELAKVEVFPNPNQGLFQLNFFLSEQGNAQVQIFDTNGKIVFDRALNGFQGQFREQVDMSGNRTGTYFVRVSQNGKFNTKRVVITRG